MFLIWERELAQHWQVDSHTSPDWVSNLRPRCVPWPGLKPAPFGAREDVPPTEPPHQGQGVEVILFIDQSLCTFRSLILNELTIIRLNYQDTFKSKKTCILKIIYWYDNVA